MDISPAFFFFFAGLAIVSALTVVLHRNTITSAFNLVLVFFAFASIYAMMGAHLIAALQILVYAGAIMVLFIFVIMLLNAGGPTFDLLRTNVSKRLVAAVLSVALIAVFIFAFRRTPSEALGPFSIAAIKESGGNLRVLSEVLFSDYILPFELTSILLLSVIVGTVAIAMRKKKAEGKNIHAS